MWLSIHRFHDNVVFDTLRVMSIATAAYIILMMAYLIVRPRQNTSLRGDRMWCAGVAVYALVAISQESGQIGKAVLWWRLPLFLIANILICVAVALRVTAAERREEHGDATNPT